MSTNSTLKSAFLVVLSSPHGVHERSVGHADHGNGAARQEGGDLQAQILYAYHARDTNRPTNLIEQMSAKLEERASVFRRTWYDPP
jgi:hypothetical protein